MGIRKSFCPGKVPRCWPREVVEFPAPEAFRSCVGVVLRAVDWSMGGTGSCRWAAGPEHPRGLLQPQQFHSCELSDPLCFSPAWCTGGSRMGVLLPQHFPPPCTLLAQGSTPRAHRRQRESPRSAPAASAPPPPPRIYSGGSEKPRQSSAKSPRLGRKRKPLGVIGAGPAAAACFEPALITAPSCSFQEAAAAAAAPPQQLCILPWLRASFA